MSVECQHEHVETRSRTLEGVTFHGKEVDEVTRVCTDCGDVLDRVTWS